MNGVPVATPYGLAVGGGLGPTLPGFISFVQSVMVPPPPFDPTTSPFIPYCYDQAYQIVYWGLQLVPGMPGAWTIYALAVYNLAADILINTAQDPADAPIYKNGLPYWQYLRQSYGVLSPGFGIVQSTSDEGTSVSMMVPGQLQNMSLADLMNMKTPYGRQYLAFMSSWGTLWGLTL